MHHYIETLEAVKEGQRADDVAKPLEAPSTLARDHEVSSCPAKREHLGLLSESQGQNQPRPESGLDCHKCAMFARQR